MSNTRSGRDRIYFTHGEYLSDNYSAHFVSLSITFVISFHFFVSVYLICTGFCEITFLSMMPHALSSSSLCETMVVLAEPITSLIVEYVLAPSSIALMMKITRFFQRSSNSFVDFGHEYVGALTMHQL